MIRTPMLLVLVLSLVGCQSMKPAGDLLSNTSGSATASPPVSTEDKADLQLAMADAAAKRGDHESAIQAYKHVLKSGVDRPEVLHRMALAHDRLGQADEARQLYEAVLAETPENHEVRCDYGYHLYLAQNWDQSESQLREAIRFKPDLSRARNILGMLLARTGRTDAALTEFARAGIPQSEAHANVALAMVLEDNQSEAARHMSVAASLDSSNDMQHRLATYRDALAALQVRRDTATNVELASYQISDVAQPESAPQ